MGMVKNPDAVYFTSLNDLWQFGNEERATGTTFQLGFLTNLNYQFQKSYYDNYSYYAQNIVRSTDKNHLNDESVGVIFSAESYKPIKLKWQRFVSADASFRHNFTDSDNSIPDSNGFNQSASFGYGWFKNTRTNAKLGLQETFQYLNYQGNNQVDKITSVGLRLFGNLNYYFSPKLRLSLNPNLLCNYSKDSKKSTTLTFINNLQLTYSIF
jgi:hypothetical protein